jgi:hypothetical protein
VKPRTTVLERVAIGVVSLALSVGLIALLSGYFAGQDPANISGGSVDVGLKFRDLGHRHLAPGELRPSYDSNPPTSGAHIPQPLTSANGSLNDNQLLQALEVGDVVFAYGTPSAPPGLEQLAHSIGGRFSPALAAAGQTVILDHRAGTRGVIALAWTRMLQVRSAADPSLKVFAQELLGRGAPGG